MFNDLSNIDEIFDNLKKYNRLANYIGAAQLYLKDNFFLEKPLSKDDIKNRILGHWGTVPGLNLFYSEANILIQKHKINSMFIAGPGHGLPAVLANLYLEGTLGDFYPEYKVGKNGMENIIRDFSWPNKFPSHVNPNIPGAILEGGELGYSLGTAFGAAFDNPDLLVFCVVGDGESETGTLATSWHSNKFLNPKTDGAVLPIIHLNKYKISGPTVYSSMDDYELMNLFTGYGYQPIIVAEENLVSDLYYAYEKAYKLIKEIQDEARLHNHISKPRWPMLIVRSPKGLSAPQNFAGKPLVDSFRSHGIPLDNPAGDEEQFETLKAWLESYRINELLDEEKKPITEITDLIPDRDLRMGHTPIANSGMKKSLRMPSPYSYEINVDKKGVNLNSSMKVASNFLRDITKMNPDSFRIMSPDETESNKLHSVFEATTRQYIWPVPKNSEDVSMDGRIMEVLSENLLMSWMQGYVLTGRHSIFISYEAFLMIIASMIDQYAKFIAKQNEVSWRKSIPSINFVLTSNAWRQDHNGYSHQNPGFISNALNKHSNSVNIFFPADANSFIATLDENFRSVNKINIVIAGKTDLPQYLTIREAQDQAVDGIANWTWAGNDQANADVVFVATGDYMANETIHAISLLKEFAPEIKTRMIYVSELTAFGIGDNHNLCRINSEKFNEVFTSNKPIIYAYHGYPEDIKQLVFNHPAAKRMDIRGYIEKGTTTTPFDMMVQNKCSRFDLAIAALESINPKDTFIKKAIKNHITYFKALLGKHEIFINEHGYDIPEVLDAKLNLDKNE